MTTTIPPRPKATTEMIAAAAKAVADQHSWGDNAAAAIVRQYHRNADGFALMKDLEKWESWDCERDDIERLDEVDNLVRKAVSEAERAWAADNQITPPLPIGALIELHDHPAGGRIMGVFENAPAIYKVKPVGQDDAKTGTMRRLIKFEDAVLAEPALAGGA